MQMCEVVALHNESLKLSTWFNNTEKLSHCSRGIDESGNIAIFHSWKESSVVSWWVEKRNRGKELLGHLIQAPGNTTKPDSPYCIFSGRKY